MYIRNGCAVNDAEMSQNHYVFDPSDEAQRIIKTVMEANFLEPNFVVKSGDVENAIATIEGGQRYIIYNTTYIERIKRSRGSDWPAFYVFAHEIGHHLSNHRFDLNDDVKSKEQELKADVFAGGMLYRLGATLDEAQEGIGSDFKESGSRTHPPRKARLEAIASGWKKAYDQSGGVQPGYLQITKIENSGKSDPPIGRRQKTGFTMVPVSAGNYTMGTPIEKFCEHDVAVESFEIGMYEVTQADWREIMGTNPSKNNGCDDCPVENVLYNEVQEFIQKANEKYNSNYRLPTEEEWEFAARGGNNATGYYFSGDNNPDVVAWHADNSRGKTQPVGLKQPNELGLHDMSGNVRELCSGTYASYPCDPNPETDRSKRFVRGGIDYSDRNLGDGFKYQQGVGGRGSFPDIPSPKIGFRLSKN
jgi:formylglycine-generating enzyme required for sulfatase activity